MFHVPVDEQETVITFSRTSEECLVWTSDKTVMTKLDKLAENPDSPWECIDMGCTNFDGEGNILTKEYKGLKSLLTFREKKKQLSDAQREKQAEFLRELSRKSDFNPLEDK